MLGDDTLDRIATEWAAAVAGEQRSVRHIALFIDPGFDDLRRIAPQGCRTVLAPLAMAPHMGTASEFDIPDPEADQFRHPKAGLRGEHQQRPITPSVPGGEVGRGDERLDLVFREPGHGATFVPLCRQLQDLLAMVQDLGFVDRDMTEEGTDGGKTDVAALRAVAAFGLEMFEKVPDKVGIDVLRCPCPLTPVRTVPRQIQGAAGRYHDSLRSCSRRPRAG